MNRTDLYYEDFLDLFNFYDLNFNENEFNIYLNNYQINDKFEQQYFDQIYDKLYSSKIKNTLLINIKKFEQFSIINKIINIILKPIIKKVNKYDKLIAINSFKNFQYTEFKYFCFELLIYIFKQNYRDNYFEVFYLLNKDSLKKYFNNLEIEFIIKHNYFVWNWQRINLFDNWKNTPIFLKYLSYFFSRKNFEIYYYDILSKSDYSDIITYNNDIISWDKLNEIGIKKIKELFKNFNIIENNYILNRFKCILSINTDGFNDFFSIIIGYLFLKCPKEYKKLINFFYDNYNINSLMSKEDVLYKINLNSGLYMDISKYIEDNFKFKLPNSCAKRKEYFDVQYLKTSLENIKDKMKEIITRFLNKYYKNCYINLNIDNFIDNVFNLNFIVPADKYTFLIILDYINEINQKYIDEWIYKFIYQWDNTFLDKIAQIRISNKNSYVLLDSYDPKKTQNSLKEYFSNFSFEINSNNISPIVLIDNNMLSVISRSEFAYFEKMGDILYNIIINDLILDSKLEYIDNYQQYYMSAFFQNKLASIFDISQYIQTNGLHFGEKEKFENADYLEAILYQIYKNNDYNIAKKFIIELLTKTNNIIDCSKYKNELINKYPYLDEWQKMYPNDFVFSENEFHYTDGSSIINVPYDNYIFKVNLIKSFFKFVILEMARDKKIPNILDSKKELIKFGDILYDNICSLLIYPPCLITNELIIHEFYRSFKKDPTYFANCIRKIVEKYDSNLNVK